MMMFNLKLYLFYYCCFTVRVGDTAILVSQLILKALFMIRILHDTYDKSKALCKLHYF